MSATLLLVHILGIVTLMLWGMRMVRTGVERATGPILQTAMQRCFQTRVRSFMSGVAVTLALQSSTATTILVNGFLLEGTVGTAAALAVVLGADVGSTLVAGVLSFDLSAVAPFLITVGFVVHATSSQAMTRQLARATMGLGVVLLALQLLRGYTAQLTESDVLPVVLTALADEPVIALVIFALMTWLLHSSLAAVLFTATLAQAGVIALDLAALLVLGANLGAALPALGATVGLPRHARRLPLGNMGFKFLGVVFMIPFLGVAVSAANALGAPAAQTVIAFHLGFNLLVAMVFVRTTEIAAAMLEKRLPKDHRPEDSEGASRLLEAYLLRDPETALSAAAREAIRLGDFVQGMLRDVITALHDNDRQLAKEIAARDDAVDRLHREIKLFVTQASREVLSETQSRRATQILIFATDLEHIGDIVESIASYARRKSVQGLQFSAAGMSDLDRLHEHVMKSMHTAMNVFMTGDATLAQQLIAEKRRVNRIERALARSHLKRLRDGLPESVETSSFHQDILRDLKRIHSHLVAVAYTTVADTESEADAD